jgi:flagellar biosynthesis protein FliR
LNLFAVGFPASLALGLIIIMLGMPAVQTTFIKFVDNGLRMMANMIGGN